MEEDEEFEFEIEYDNSHVIIDEEIKDRLWKLSDIEFDNLKQSIIKEGCRDSIILWNNIIIDGHNRYKICIDNDITFKTVQKQFNDKNEVLKWIDTNQLSRRNLTDEQRTILRARISRLNKQDGFKGNQHTESGSGQNVLNQQTAAKDLGVTDRTLRRDEQYLDAIEKIEKNTNKDIVSDILAGKTSLTKQDTIKISKLEPEKQIDTLKEIIKSKLKLKEVISNERINVIVNEDHKNIKGIKNCDCIDYIDEIEDNSIDCMITDPPYGVALKLNKYINVNNNRKIENDFDIDNAMKLLDNLLSKSKSKLKDNAHLYIFCSWKVYPEFKEVIEKYHTIKNLIVWNKTKMGMGDLKYNYGDSYELIIFAGGNREFIKRPSNIIECSFTDERFHNTQKPIELLEQLIENSTNVGDVIYDPFLGSGSTAVAAINKKRKVIGSEIDEQNYKITLNRINILL